MTYRNRTRTERWEIEQSYERNWASRSTALMEMFLGSEADATASYRLSEYGCGPYSPFATYLADNSRFRVRKFDIRDWDDQTAVVDLNDPGFRFEEADVATFSGVLEYLNDVTGVLSKALLAHDYLLLSYASQPLVARARDSRFLKDIRHRAVESGWRNHYSNEELVRIIASIGVISDVGTWKTQTLFVVRSKRY